MKIDFDVFDLRPMIEQVVAETITQLDKDRAKLGGRIAFSEPEAAATLGIQRHALRDARLRGEVHASRIGKRVVYARENLLALLARNRLG